MDIVIKGRNVEVPEHYRIHVSGKVARLARYDRKLSHVDVELFHEPNRRQHKNCQRVEITTIVRGQAVRAESAAGDFYAALDCAVSKLENRLRRMHDRRKVHYGRRSPASVAEATAGRLPAVAPEPVVFGVRDGSQVASAPAAVLTRAEAPAARLEHDRISGDIEVPAQRWHDGLDDRPDDRRPGRVMREKEHPSKPMSVDQALYQMELVGHDFYLFSDAATGAPSVVYRRRAFDYGVIRLV
jgi:ribosomal subunit interface protein